MIVELELCWGTVPEVGLVELIDIAAATGFASITLRPAMYLDALASGTSAAELRQRLDDRGVVVGVIDPLVAALPNVPAPEDVPEAFRRFAECTEDHCWKAAADLGCPLVNVAQFLGEPAPLDALATAVGDLAGRAAAHGVALSVEFIPGTGIPDLAAARQIVTVAGGAVGVMFDTWHFHRSGADLDELEDLVTTKVAGIQLNDTSGPPPSGVYVPMVDRLLPGHGELALAPMLQALLDGRPGLRVGVEVFSSHLRSHPPLEAAALAATAARQVLADLE